MALPSILALILVLSRAIHAGYSDWSAFHPQADENVWLQQPHSVDPGPEAITDFSSFDQQMLEQMMCEVQDNPMAHSTYSFPRNDQQFQGVNDQFSFGQTADFPMVTLDRDFVRPKPQMAFNVDQYYGEVSVAGNSMINHEEELDIIVNKDNRSDSAKRPRDASAVRNSKRKRTSRSLDLNLNSIEKNYEILCRLLGKEQNQDELSFLLTSIPKYKSKGPRASPMTIEVNGEQLDIPLIHCAKSSLVKLILVTRFYQKIEPIWAELRFKYKSDRALHFFYCQAQSIINCLQNCCGNDLVKFQAGRANPFHHGRFQSRRCPDHNQFVPDFPIESDLNLKSIEENYQEVCRFIGKEMDAAELTFFEALPRTKRSNNGKIVDPITVDVDGHSLYLPEWSQMRSAKSSLVKIILVARFCQKLDPIWQQLLSSQRNHHRLKYYYRDARAIMSCLRHCCDNSLTKFQNGKLNPFNHRRFSCQCSNQLLIGPIPDSGFKEETGEERFLSKIPAESEFVYI